MTSQSKDELTDTEGVELLRPLAQFGDHGGDPLAERGGDGALGARGQEGGQDDQGQGQGHERG